MLLQQFNPFLPAPFNFLPLTPFSPFYLLLFHFSVLPAPFSFRFLLQDFSCSMLLFRMFLCSMPLFIIFCGPCSRIIICSLLLCLFYDLLLASLCQIGLAPCSRITPNRGRASVRGVHTPCSFHNFSPCLWASAAKRLNKIP